MWLVFFFLNVNQVLQQRSPRRVKTQTKLLPILTWQSCASPLLDSLLFI